MPNAFIHTELAVDDLEAAKKFYKTLFDWKLTDLGPNMGNYVMVDFGNKSSGGGIMPKAMPSQPSAWLSYVEVASVKATMAKAVKAGAQPVVPFKAIGNDMGAFGIFVDPQGAALGLWEKGAARAALTKKAGAKKATTKKAGAKKATTKKAGAKKAKRSTR